MKNKKSLGGIMILVLTLGVVGSLAYFSQEITKTNEFKTAKYDTTIEEEFTPPDDWLPGVEVNKDVTVKNNGNVDVVVKATLTELWTRENKTLSNIFVDDKGVNQRAALLALPNVVEYSANMDLSEQKGKWILYQDNYYYMGVIEEGKTSALLLDNVQLNPLLDVTTKKVHTIVTTDENGEKVTTTTTESGKYGYDDANYKLTVTANTIQATASAIKTWGTNPVIDFMVENYATIVEK
ncbi:MAG: BsaA family SipW-dependent biofilm matrix protein [Thomasclavelia sp.]|uniref:BsaA family SipW-dependent biofilm matrix protein n=1 Tax=Thomasclavelia sp. TaxID=3025757 RepID=UPI00399FD992